jgi:hypothetical protein
MATNQRRYLPCKNVSCRQPIWLPYSSQLGIFPDRLDSDNQYAEMFLCPACAHVYDYRSLSVLWKLPQTEDRGRLLGLYAVSLAFRCGIENCGSLTLIHKPTNALRDDPQFLKETSTWALGEVRCKNRHLLEALPPEMERQVYVLRSLSGIDVL